MKKLIIGIFLVLLLLTISVYVIIPSEIKIYTANLVKCVPKNINSSLHNTETWKLWWPKDVQKNTASNNSFSYNAHDYELARPLANGAEILIKKKNTYLTRITALPYKDDSIAVQWEARLPASLNPVNRVIQYWEGFTIKNDLNFLLQSLVNFSSDTKNIYGFNIVRTTFTD